MRHHIACAPLLRLTPSLRQVSEELVRKKVKDPSDFEWLKQCRCAWRKDRDTVVVSICDIDFEYSYEYLGEAPHLGCLAACNPAFRGGSRGVSLQGSCQTERQAKQVKCALSCLRSACSSQPRPPRAALRTPARRRQGAAGDHAPD